jgi:hypothetical protein
VIKPLFSQFGGVTVVVMRVRSRIGGFLRTALESVLAHDHGTFLAGLDVFRN